MALCSPTQDGFAMRDKSWSAEGFGKHVRTLILRSNWMDGDLPAGHSFLEMKEAIVDVLRSWSDLRHSSQFIRPRVVLKQPAVNLRSLSF